MGALKPVSNDKTVVQRVLVRACGPGDDMRAT